LKLARRWRLTASRLNYYSLGGGNHKRLSGARKSNRGGHPWPTRQNLHLRPVTLELPGGEGPTRRAPPTAGTLHGTRTGPWRRPRRPRPATPDCRYQGVSASAATASPPDSADRPPQRVDARLENWLQCKPSLYGCSNNRFHSIIRSP